MADDTVNLVCTNSWNYFGLKSMENRFKDEYHEKSLASKRKQLLGQLEYNVAEYYLAMVFNLLWLFKTELLISVNAIQARNG